MKPLVDTTKFRDAIKKAFVAASKLDRTPKFAEGQGVQDVPASDQETMGEETNKAYTVKHWGKWIYQKREDGKWDKLVPSLTRKTKGK